MVPSSTQSPSSISRWDQSGSASNRFEIRESPLGLELRAADLPICIPMVCPISQTAGRHLHISPHLPSPLAGLLMAPLSVSSRGGSRGIGVIFDTRKGSFRYKISLYIIIYLDCIIVYHVYHHQVSHISCPSSTHDI